MRKVRLSHDNHMTHCMRMCIQVHTSSKPTLMDILTTLHRLIKQIYTYFSIQYNFESHFVCAKLHIRALVHFCERVQ